MRGYYLGPSSDTAILVYPKDITRGRAKLETVNHTRGGKRYSVFQGAHAKYKLEVEHVSSSDAALVNSWWASDTTVMFWPQGVSSGSTVRFTNKAYPIGAWSMIDQSLFSGVIELEGTGPGITTLGNLIVGQALLTESGAQLSAEDDSIIVAG